MISTFVSYREANTITPKQLCAEELDTIQLEKRPTIFTDINSINNYNSEKDLSCNKLSCMLGFCTTYHQRTVHSSKGNNMYYERNSNRKAAIRLWVL